MDLISHSTVIMMFLGLILGALILYGFVKMTISISKARQSKPPSQVSFVVDTFHGLVAQLKEKETELLKLRKLAEERAGRMEDYNEYILQSVPSGVISMDESYRVVKANASAERILSIKAAGSIGRDARELMPDIFACFEGKMDGGGLPTLNRAECQYTTPSGRRLWLAFNLTPLLDAEGKSIGGLLVFTDLTELKALEAQAAIRQRLASLGEMAAGIAHELRNPMGVISGYVQMLAKRADESSASTVQAISEEVSVMDRIISDFLSFARPPKPDLAQIEISSIIRECVRKAGPGGSHEFQVVMPELKLRADEVMMRQVFTNLIQNALDAMPDGGRLTINAEVVEGYALIRVADTGHGIEPGMADRIFNPFFTTKDKGTGLGLALVHRIVTAHGGTIGMRSSDKGTEFALRLPIAGPQG